MNQNTTTIPTTTKATKATRTTRSTTTDIGALINRIGFWVLLVILIV